MVSLPFLWACSSCLLAVYGASASRSSDGAVRKLCLSDASESKQQQQQIFDLVLWSGWTQLVQLWVQVVMYHHGQWVAIQEEFMVESVLGSRYLSEM